MEQLFKEEDFYKDNGWPSERLVYSKYFLKVGSINSIFYFLHKAAEPFNCLEQDNLA